MSQRAASLVIGLVGVLFVVALIVLGIDICRAAGTGPPWRRRLLGAGLSLLVALGIPVGDAAGAEAPQAAEAPKAASLPDTPEWRRLVATWHDAAEVASGLRGPFPFTSAEKSRLLAALGLGVKDVEAWQKAGQLSEAEAGLLLVALAQLKSGVDWKRTVEDGPILCYEPALILRPSDSVRRVAARLPLLEKLAATQRIVPEVARIALASVELDLAFLQRKEVIKLLATGRDPDAQGVCQTAIAQLRKVQERLPPARPALRGDQPFEWHATEKAYDKWAWGIYHKGDRQPHAEWCKAVVQQMEWAQATAFFLARVGLLAPEEAEAVTREAEAFRSSAKQDSPTDPMVVACAKGEETTARRSLNRLVRRLAIVNALGMDWRYYPVDSWGCLRSIKADIAIVAAARKAGPRPDRLGGAPDWLVIEQAWRLAAPLAASGRCTEAQSQEADEWLDAVPACARRLAAGKLLAPEEAVLLTSEAANLDEDIGRSLPAGSEIEGRKMAPFVPAANSLERLSQRLPFVEKLVAGGQVHEAACARIVAAMQADLAVLDDPKEVAKLPEGDRPKAQQMVKQAGEALRKLRAFVYPACYDVQLMLPRRPRSRRELDERLARIETLEGQGRILPAVAALLREGIEQEGADREWPHHPPVPPRSPNRRNGNT